MSVENFIISLKSQQFLCFDFEEFFSSLAIVIDEGRKCFRLFHFDIGQSFCQLSSMRRFT